MAKITTEIEIDTGISISVRKKTYRSSIGSPPFEFSGCPGGPERRTPAPGEGRAAGTYSTGFMSRTVCDRNLVPRTGSGTVTVSALKARFVVGW